MDSTWSVDIKKSSAQLPPVVRDRLKQVIARIQAGSTRTYQKRGQKLVDQERLPMWVRVQADRQIRYRPNLEHPVFVEFASRLSEELRRGFDNCITLVGASLPVETIFADLAVAHEQIVPDRVDEDTLIQAVGSMLHVLRGVNKSIDEILALMRDVEPFRSSWADTQRIIRDIVNQEHQT